MEVLKNWTFNICITLLVSTIISVLLPTGSIGKYAKIIVSLFILLSVLTPIAGENFKIDFPVYEYSESIDENNQVYSALIETKISESLISSGYSGINISCEINTNNGEITVEKIIAVIPDKYSKNEIKEYIFNELGFVAEVYYVGE